jgi:hypothetical protein
LSALVCRDGTDDLVGATLCELDYLVKINMQAR